MNTVFKENTRFRALFASLLLSAIGFGLYKGVIDNYLAEVAGMTEMDRGIAEFFRELPGLLLVVILAVYIIKKVASCMVKTIVCLVLLAALAAAYFYFIR